MSLLLDANTLITAQNQYYAFDIVPSFWSVLQKKFQTGEIKIIDVVEDEILHFEDELTTWLQQFISGHSCENGDNYVIPARQISQIISYYQEIANKIMGNNNYLHRHKEKFLSGADPWLIATAKAGNHTVVTLEKMPNLGTTKVKIPDVCQQFEVKCIDLFAMMRELKIII